MFWKVWNESKYVLPSPDLFKEGTCFSFIFSEKFNRYVVDFESSVITLISARIDGSLVSNLSEISEKYQWKLPKQYHFESIKELIENVREINPFLRKGLIVLRKKQDDPLNFQFLEMRSSKYVAVQTTLTFRNEGFGPINLRAGKL